MSNLSDFLGGGVYTNTKNYLLPRTVAYSTLVTPLDWDSSTTDMILLNYGSLGGVSFTINADSATSPIDGQRLVIRVITNGGSGVMTFIGGSAKSFRPIGTSFTVSGSNYTITLVAGTSYFGCIFNGISNRWDIVSVSEQLV